MAGSYGVTEGVLKEVQHETVEEALDAKQGLGRKWRGRGGVHASGANGVKDAGSVPRTVGKWHSNARPGQLAWRPLGLGPGVMSVRVNMTLGTRFLEAAWDSGWGPACGIRQA